MLLPAFCFVSMLALAGCQTTKLDDGVQICTEGDTANFPSLCLVYKTRIQQPQNGGIDEKSYTAPGGSVYK